MPVNVPPLAERARETLREVWGHQEFRPDQAEVVQAILQKRNVALIMPTGGGKSVTYQVPAILNYREKGEITIVVTPTISLMRDQVAHLNQFGVNAAHFYYDQVDAQRRANEELLHKGEAPLLYVTPERLTSPKARSLIEATYLNKGRPGIAMVVFDEAHVIARWGHDFRYAYGKKLQETLAWLNKPQVMFCSATLPEPIRQDVLNTLSIDPKECYFREMPMDRPNLKLRVRSFPGDAAKRTALLERLGNPPLEELEKGQTIIYCNTRRGTEELSDFLRKKGFKARHYHAGMEPADRLATEYAFRDKAFDILAATIAFGMGVDNKNVNQVIHYQIPKSLEDYVQESGRAGRNGKLAVAELWFDPADIDRQIGFLVGNNPNGQYIIDYYLHLWSRVKDERAANPSCFLHMKKEFDREGEFGHMVAHKQAALCVLLECGAIDIEGWNIIFRSSKRDGIKLIPTDRELSEKYDAGMQSLAVMTYYASTREFTETDRQERSLRKIISDHFEHNTIIDRLPGRDPRSMIALDERRILDIVRLVNNRDYELSELVAARVTTEEGLTRDDVIGLIEHACALGYLRIHRRLDGGFVSLTKKGANVLERLLPQNESPVIAPSTDAKGLLQRIGHYIEIETLQAAFANWYLKECRPAKDEQTLTKAIQRLLGTRITIFDRDITARELIARWAGLPARQQDKVNARVTRMFLTYLFGDPLRKRADETTKLL